MISPWSCLRQGVEVLVRRFPLLFGVWLVILAAQQLIDLVTPEGWVWAGLAVQVVVLAPLYAGQFLLALRVLRNEPAAFADVVQAMARWPTLAAIAVVTALLASVGMVLLIIPGIVWALTFAFAPIVVLDRSRNADASQVGVFAAMARSKELTAGHRGTLFGISFLLAIPTIVIAALVIASAYVPTLRIPYWAIELFSLFSGTLFLGPLHAASYMVAYDAITRLERRHDATPLHSAAGDAVNPVGK